MRLNIKRYANSAIKVLVFVFLSWTIYQQVFRSKSWSEIEQYYILNISDQTLFSMLVVFLLMILNWYLESWKWKIIIKPIQKIRLWDCYKAVFSGITLSIFTPNRIGEFGGRIFYLKTRNRVKAIFATLIGSFANILSVIIFGIIGVFSQLDFLSDKVKLKPSVIITLGVLGLLLAITMYYNLKHMPKLADRRWFKSRARNVLSIFTQYNKQVLTQLLSLSIVRYLVFAGQYILLLNFFGVQMDWFLGMSRVGMIYLAQTVIPSIAVAELGIRGNVALFFLKDLMISEEMKIGVVSATFSLWLINLIIPAAFGAFFMLRLRIVNNR